MPNVFYFLFYFNKWSIIVLKRTNIKTGWIMKQKQLKRFQCDESHAHIQIKERTKKKISIFVSRSKLEEPFGLTFLFSSSVSWNLFLSIHLSLYFIRSNSISKMCKADTGKQITLKPFRIFIKSFYRLSWPLFKQKSLMHSHRCEHLPRRNKKTLN